MEKIVVLFCMIFCHLLDDYYLQGWLASAKQKKWWEKNNPDPLYKHDYIMALIEHAFSWTFMIHVPVIAYMLSNKTTYPAGLIMIFCANWIIHAFTDHAKSNLHWINLIHDQCIHFMQIILTWAIYMT